MEKPLLTRNPRLLNHFCLGADPEFMFEDRGQPFAAQNLPFKTGLFVGADQNGRLVEVRPQPSRWALDVLASTLDSLRWMVLLYPETLEFNWKTGAYLHGDGLGGHIHFGRKRPTRQEEILALDGVCRVMTGLGVFPAKEVELRMAGDARGQRYGLPSDYRLQVHGYEYRTFPSWMTSPWAAYLSLVLAKLAVINPNLVSAWQDGTIEPNFNMVRNLLAYYQANDDDARLAYHALMTRKLPKHVADFRKHWGLEYTTAYSKRDITILPKNLTPTEGSRQQLFDYLVNGAELKPQDMTPSWGPTSLPMGFFLMSDKVKTVQQVGLGEMIWDMVGHDKFPLLIKPAAEAIGDVMMISSKVASTLPRSWRSTLQRLMPGVAVVPFIKDESSIWISKGLRKNGVKAELARQALLESGLFPLWRTKDVKADVLTRWVNPVSAKPKERAYGRIEVVR